MNYSPLGKAALLTIQRLELEKDALRKENARLYMELVEARNIDRGMVDEIRNCQKCSLFFKSNYGEDELCKNCLQELLACGPWPVDPNGPKGVDKP